MVPPLRYKGKFISQRNYDIMMKRLENLAKAHRLNRERREARKAESEVKTRSLEPSEEPAAAASPPRSPVPSPPIPTKTAAAKKEKPKTETSKKRGIKRKASPVKSGPASKRSAVDKQNLENSPQQANVSSGSAKSDDE